MTQGPYWDWLYKNGQQPSPTPAWPLDQQLYPPGPAQPWYTPQALAGDPSGGMSWRNSLRGTPPMPWHYYPIPLQMQGGPTPYQSRPVFRNDYAPQDTTQPSGSIGGKPLYSPAQQNGAPPAPTSPWPTSPAAPTYGAGQTGVYNGSVVAAPQFAMPTLAPLGAAPAQADGGGKPAAGAAAAPQAQAPNPGTNPASWDVQGEWGSPQAPAAPAEWSLNDYVYNPDNPYAGVPWEYWGDPSLVAYINAQAARGGSGGSNNYAWSNAFNQAQEDARNAQWAQTFQQNTDQWNQKLAAEQAQNARLAEQWQKEMERNQAVDRWTQAFQQAQQDWNKTDAEAKNRLQDQGQNLGAFGRRFGPNVAYM